MKQFAGGNASTGADRMWGIQRAFPGTHFPSSLRKPLQTHADLHEATLQQYRAPAASRILPKTVASSVGLALNRFSTATQTRRNVDLSHVPYHDPRPQKPRFSNSMLYLP